jgi:hypothetical protein
LKEQPGTMGEQPGTLKEQLGIVGLIFVFENIFSFF